jgi:hypothetical protein
MQSSAGKPEVRSFDVAGDLVVPRAHGRQPQFDDEDKIFKKLLRA